VTFDPLVGGCLCGGVRYRVTAPLLRAGYCHCTRCQRRSGTAASAIVVVDGASVEITAGADLVKTHSTEDGLPKSFCRECGSGLWALDRQSGAIRAIRTGTFDGDPGVVPTWRQYVGVAVPWESIPDDGIERFDGPRQA
jgi:hypothetical protein